MRTRGVIDWEVLEIIMSSDVLKHIYIFIDKVCYHLCILLKGYDVVFDCLKYFKNLFLSKILHLCLGAHYTQNNMVVSIYNNSKVSWNVAVLINNKLVILYEYGKEIAISTLLINLMFMSMNEADPLNIYNLNFCLFYPS